jgi:hypothetical protein
MGVMRRADGYYWIDPADGREYGPFTTLLEAGKKKPKPAKGERRARRAPAPSPTAVS